MTEHPRPIKNPLLELSAFDSDAGKPMLLCVVPGDAGAVRFAVPAIYLELIEQFDGARSAGQAIDAFIERRPGLFQRPWLQRLVDESLIPKGLLVHEHQDPGRAGASTQPKRAFLHIKLPIVPPGVVDPVARRLGFLFRREALALGLIAFLASHVYVYAVLLHERPVDFNRLDAAAILWLMLLSTAGTIVHEFGHAAAAARYGCRRMTIGWGLYLIYPVLWTDVSQAWKLPRRQRAVVDIGGVYFESIFLLLMLALYLNTGDVVFLFAFVVVDLSIATTFNPFLRMDGYWLMSDLFGIVNLRKQQLVWLRGIAHMLFGGAAPAVRSNLTAKARWVLGIYTVLGLLFLAYIVTVIFKFAVLDVLGEYPHLVQAFWQHLRAGMSVPQFLNGVLELMWRTLMLFGASVTLWSLGRGAIGMAGTVCVARASARQHGSV